MAIIQLTQGMTEQEERETQNSNNNFLNIDKISTSQKAIANGVATLNASGDIVQYSALGTDATATIQYVAGAARNIRFSKMGHQVFVRADMYVGELGANIPADAKIGTIPSGYAPLGSVAVPLYHKTLGGALLLTASGDILAEPNSTSGLQGLVSPIAYLR